MLGLLAAWAFSTSGKQGLLSSSGAWAFLCGGSLVVAHGLRSFQASVVAACGLSCPTSCGVFPDHGLNWYPLLQGRFITSGLLGKPRCSAFKNQMWGFPRGSLVKNLPANAGAWLHAPNYWACTLEPWSHNYWAHVLQLVGPICLRAYAPEEEKPLQWEAHALLLESSPHWPQLEKILCSSEDLAQWKRNNKKERTKCD